MDRYLPSLPVQPEGQTQWGQSRSHDYNVKLFRKHLGDVRTLWTFIMVPVMAIMMIMVTTAAPVLLLLLLLSFGRIRMGATLRMLCFGQRPAIG